MTLILIQSFTQQPAWGCGREFDITTQSVSHHGIAQVHSCKKHKVSFLPNTGVVSSSLKLFLAYVFIKI